MDFLVIINFLLAAILIVLYRVTKERNLRVLLLVGAVAEVLAGILEILYLTGLYR